MLDAVRGATGVPVLIGLTTLKTGNSRVLASARAIGDHGSMRDAVRGATGVPALRGL